MLLNSNLAANLLLTFTCGFTPQMDTRQWGVPGEDYYVLLPVADLANHRQGCKNTMALEPCDSTNPQNHEKCWIWTAQERVAAGQEVCISYNHLTQDMALLQFGFLQVRPHILRCA